MCPILSYQNIATLTTVYFLPVNYAHSSVVASKIGEQSEFLRHTSYWQI